VRERRSTSVFVDRDSCWDLLGNSFVLGVRVSVGTRVSGNTRIGVVYLFGRSSFGVRRLVIWLFGFVFVGDFGGSSRWRNPLLSVARLMQ